MVRLWDVTTGQEVLALAGHNHWIYGLAFSPPDMKMREPNTSEIGLETVGLTPGAWQPVETSAPAGPRSRNL